ncbi:hypothetical protein GMDG_08700 [Pseudogymnoascus destructans 20631-21]|uniref:Uncharacterized protein n=1 Tax=Pseudogymnoascus destructans (strain ATCC MYA-4855 / 20631-21) TaxID=658429 RepID=L8GCA6_PSED2|nr:hypothetical protein GMDG_08700 [Pseudogymnoascus destructans 20631-21]
MDLLGSYYLTGNETEQARNLFDNLQMGEKGHASETFPEFKARFQSAAITGQVSESEWFQYMWNKLTPQFRSRVAIVTVHQGIGRQLGTVPEQRIESATRSRKDVHTYHGYGKGVSGKADSSHICSVHPNCVPPQASHTGCGKPGHFQDKCPLNATIKEMDCNDPEAEEQWEEAVELQSDASLEENDEA